jgi:LysM repeat protein
MTARALLRRFGGVGVAILLAVAVTASATGVGHYRVRPGDTLSAIAARYHTSVAALVRLNNLPGSGNLIFAGSTLKIPGRAHHHHARRHTHARTHTVVRTYVVRPGDSLYAIAARFHASWRAIAHRSHLPSSLMVVIGQRLRIPHQVRIRHHHHHHRASGSFHGIYIPSRTAVVGMIRATAHRWHVDPRLALGVSYEEAGFNQRVISSVGAVGAMQIMPGTGAWLSRYVVHRHLNIYRAQDNVTAGVALLSVLLRETNGNSRVAVAGYYQGLASVRQRGMYDDTKRYVANVLALRNRF